MANDLEAPEDGSARVYRVTNRQVIALATTIITTFGAIGVAYYSNRPDNQDRFYGYEGRDLQQKFAKFIEWRDTDLEKWADGIDLKVQRIESTDAACDLRVSRLEGRLDEHIREHERFKDSIRSQLRSFAITDERHQTMLSECLRRTGLE